MQSNYFDDNSSFEYKISSGSDSEDKKCLSVKMLIQKCYQSNFTTKEYNEKNTEDEVPQVVDTLLKPNDKKNESIKTEVNVKSEPIDDFTDFVIPSPNLSIIKYEESVEIVDEKIEVDFTGSLMQVYDNQSSSNRTEENKKDESTYFESRKTSNESDEHDENNYARLMVKEKRYQCPHCNKSYLTNARLKCHISNECKLNAKRKNRFKCKQCKIEFASKYTFNRHKFFIHKVQEGKKRCLFCQLEFKTEVDIEKHLKEMPCQRSFAGPSQCKNCGRKYQIRSGLLRHLKHECGKPPRFGCAHCSHFTSQKANLIKHLARVHNIPTKLSIRVCPKCKRTYKNDCSLNRHLKFECGQKPKFKCKLCNYSAKRNYSLKQHMKNKHLHLINKDLLEK